MEKKKRREIQRTTIYRITQPHEMCHVYALRHRDVFNGSKSPVDNSLTLRALATRAAASTRCFEEMQQVIRYLVARI